MRHIRQSTSVDLPIGPFLDDTDGKTAETALTLTQPDIRLKKNAAAWAQKAAAQTLAHEENGWYEVTLDATDTDTIGHLMLAVNETGALPVWHEFHVLAANVYDSLYGAATDKIQVDIAESLGVAITNEDGTCQSGSTSTTIVLATTASAVDDYYSNPPQVVRIVGGTGAGQAKPIIDYDGASRVGTILGAWATTPDNTSKYIFEGNIQYIETYYYADIQFTRDQAAGTPADEWSVTWFKNGVPLTSGITSPTLQLVKRVDGTDLKAATAMTQIGTTGSYKLDLTGADRITVGEAVIAVAAATIDGSARSFRRQVGRDSA